MLDGKKMKRADICDGVEVVLDARLLEFALLLRLPFKQPLLCTTLLFFCARLDMTA